MNLAAVSVVAFDAFGTIFDTADGSMRATRAILAPYGMEENIAVHYARWKELHKARMRAQPFSREEDIFKLGLGDLFEELGIPRERAERDVRPMLDTLDKRAAFSDAREVLDGLAGRRHVVIASNSDEAPLAANLRANEIVVSQHYSSETLRAYKPQPEFYARLGEALGVSLDRILYVGDSPDEDVRGPKAAGMQAVWVNRRGARLAAGIPAPEMEITTLRELLRVL